MTPDQRIQKVYDALTRKTYNGDGWSLARKLGMNYPQFRQVLATVRSRDWIEMHGGTIPFCGQGNPGPYAIVETRSQAEVYLHSGNRRRGGDILGSLRNFDTQCDHGLVLLDKRTAEGRWNSLASAQVKAMVALAENLGL